MNKRLAFATFRVNNHYVHISRKNYCMRETFTSRCAPPTKKYLIYDLNISTIANSINDISGENVR